MARPGRLDVASGGSISKGANHEAWQQMGLRRRATAARAGMVGILGAAVLKLNRGPSFKADPAGQGHDADRRPAAQAPLAPEDLDEKV